MLEMDKVSAEVVTVSVLVSILVLLMVISVIAALVLLKKRRMWCFKVDLDAQPFLLNANKDWLVKGTGKAWKSRPISGILGKNITKKAANRKKRKVNYQSLSRVPKFSRRDPFAGKFLENPLVDDDEFDMDWSNPAFDQEGAQQLDAAVTIQSWYRMVRIRVPYVQLRDGIIQAQALFRGRQVRKLLPQLKKEKHLRDHQRKKQVGWKKKGTVAALKFFEVKGFGFAEVEQLYGLGTIRNAADQLKTLYGGKGKMKLKLFISVNGIKLFDFHTMKHFATVKVSSVSFCTLDPKNKKLFAFINRKKKRNFCHIFQASEHDAQKMVETMAEAFEITFKRVEQIRHEREMAKLAYLKKRAFHRQSQQLDEEVASMMEMAESASSIILDRQSEGSTASDGSVTGSRERLIPARHRSSLVTNSKKAQPRQQVQAEVESQEEFDALKLDDYFTDIKDGVDVITDELERDSKQARLDAEKLRLDKSLHQMVERFSY